MGGSGFLGGGGDIYLWSVQGVIETKYLLGMTDNSYQQVIIMPSAFNLTKIQEKEISAIIRAGYYSNKSEVVRDAIRTFFESKPRLRRAAAVELYMTGEYTLSKCAEIAGITTIEFKEILRDRGIRIRTIVESKESIKKGAEVIGRKKKKRQS